MRTPAYSVIEGLEKFEGKQFHSQHWDHDYDFRGKRVLVSNNYYSALAQDHVDVLTDGSKSWYVKENGKHTTLWPGFIWQFRQQTRRFDAWEYRCEPEAAVAIKEMTAVTQ